MSAPSAAVAVQPYQYIAGTRNPIAGSATSLRMMRAQKDNTERGINGEKSEIALSATT